MQKVLLVTIWDNKNIGNRLQALALKTIIEDMNYCVISAKYDNDDARRRIITWLKQFLGGLGINKYRKAYCMKFRKRAMKSCENLIGLTTKNIRLFNTKGKIKQEDYIAAVTGSDQVWHKWKNTFAELPFFYLSFMPPKKRISYAASFGFEEFPEKDYEQHKIGLEGMRFISCREQSGCELVSQITGKRGELVLDPTLCIDSEIWKDLEEKPQYVEPNHPYILLFMLGKQEAYREAIEKYAKCHKLVIIDLYDRNRIDVWKTTIGGFLWLVHNADMICTDSFHCTVFSILFEKNFQVFCRQGKGFEYMYNRIETLLTLTGLESSQFDGESVKTNNLDFGFAKERIEMEKERSIRWLKKSLVEVTQQDYAK